jgi:hypothetical protein
MMLADAAQSVAGKLYILGGGWSVMALPPQPSAIALHIRVPWDEANRRHQLRIELLNIDGEPVLIDTPIGMQALRIENEFEVGRPPGVKPGSSLDLSLALNFAPIPLDPGGRYEWRLSIGGQSDDAWRLPFTVAG